MLIFVIYLILFFDLNIALMLYMTDLNLVQIIGIASMAVAILVQRFLHKQPIRDLGYRLCTWKQALAGLLLPIVILGLVLGIGYLLGFITVWKGANQVPLTTIIFTLLLQGLLLSVIEMVAEELFYRGYVLGKLRQWLGDGRGLLVSMLIFGLWHLPVSMFVIHAAPERIPLYVFNMFLLGGLFGLIFMESGSLIPAALFHGFWNALEYALTGFGNEQGLLTGASRFLFDPEEGVIGTVILLIFFIVLLYRSGLIPWFRLRRAAAAQA